MSLTKTERLILANQYRIRALLESSYANDHNQVAEALECGYSIDYPFEHIYDEMSESECRFVHDVLDMFEGLQRSLEMATDKDGITEASVAYGGFDGNNETKHMAFARYTIEQLKKWNYLKIASQNSHMARIGKYRKMLSKAKEFGGAYDLTTAQIKEVLKA